MAEILAPPPLITLEGDRIPVRFARPKTVSTGHLQLGEFKNGKITLHPGMTAADERATLIHEILHAIITRAECKVPKKIEEYVLSSIDTWIVVLFRENPELVKYLTEEAS